MVQLKDFFVIKEKTHFSMIHYVQIAPGLVHFILGLGAAGGRGAGTGRRQCASADGLCLGFAAVGGLW